MDLKVQNYEVTRGSGVEDDTRERISQPYEPGGMLGGNLNGAVDGFGNRNLEETSLRELQLFIIDAFWRCFREDQEDISLAAVHALAALVANSSTLSVLELFVEVKAAAETLEMYTLRQDVLQHIRKFSTAKRLTTLPLRSACVLYQQFALRHFERRPDIEVSEMKDLLIAQAAKFAARIYKSKQTIADIGRIMFTKDFMVVLTHGPSSCVEKLLRDAWQHKKRFSVIVTRQENGRQIHYLPGIFSQQGAVFHDENDSFVEDLRAQGIPTECANAGSAGRLMADVDLVVVGTEAVAENGGIINRDGTATIAMVAHHYCVPFYVVCEACKFTRTPPLQQRDVGKFSIAAHCAKDGSPPGYRKYLDYTPPEYISLLFTDLGIFTPKSVSDELTKLFET